MKHPGRIGSSWRGHRYRHGPRRHPPSRYIEFRLGPGLKSGKRFVFGKVKGTNRWEVQSTLIPIPKRRKDGIVQRYRMKRKNFGMAWDFGEAGYVEHMDPDRYIWESGDPHIGSDRYEKEGYYDIEHKTQRPLSELAEKITSSTALVEPPCLARYQEGRHRAAAAKLAGLQTIPVSVPLPEAHRASLADEFIEARFPDADESYKEEWRDRFKSIPHQYMDKKSRKIYFDILKTRGLMAS